MAGQAFSAFSIGGIANEEMLQNSSDPWWEIEFQVGHCLLEGHPRCRMLILVAGLHLVDEKKKVLQHVFGQELGQRLVIILQFGHRLKPGVEQGLEFLWESRHDVVSEWHRMIQGGSVWKMIKWVSSLMQTHEQVAQRVEK